MSLRKMGWASKKQAIQKAFMKTHFLHYFWAFLLMSAFCFSESPKWDLSADLLYWKAYEQGIAYTNKPSDVLTTDNFTKKQAINPKFGWDQGFRIGTDYTLCTAPWSLQGYWTYFETKTHGKKSFNSGPPEFLGIYPIWSQNSLSSDYVSSASFHWRLHLNLLDINMQYALSCFSDSLALKPFLGIRGAFLNQKLHADYAGGTFFSGVDINLLRNRYYGAGPRLGLNAHYALTCGFSVIGRVAIAPLFGSFRIKQWETYLESSRFHRSTTKHHLLLSTDGALGIQWKGVFAECLPCMTLVLAWEGQLFSRVNQFRRPHSHFFKKSRSLFQQGVTLSAGLDF